MPGRLAQDGTFHTISVKELHPTFGAEVIGANFHDMTEEQLLEIKAAMTKYRVLVFRQTNMSDEEQISFSRRIGPIDTIGRFLRPGQKHRFKYHELADVGNIDENGKPVAIDSPRWHFNRGNALFHSDFSFNPQRASWSMLRAVTLPPAGTGGDTVFADTLTAWDDLDNALKQDLLARDLVGTHSITHNRKQGSPTYFASLDPWTQPMSRHALIQRHEPTGRTNIYCGSHCHHIETHDGTLLPESAALIQKLNDHCAQHKYVMSVVWENEGDVVAWDNRATQHRATGGEFEGKYCRDARRTTVLDDSPTAWGLNAGKEPVALTWDAGSA